MIVKFTKAELKKIQEIKDSYTPEREKLRKHFQQETEKEKRHEIAIQQQALLDSLQAELDSFLDKAQRKRFAKIEQGGAQAIIDNAKKQVSKLLEDIHKIEKEENKGFSAEDLGKIGVGSFKNGAFFLKANYAAQALREELYLHIEALQGNREALTELLEVIIKEVEGSRFTDGGKVTEETKKDQLGFYRNHTLAKIDKFGMMKDHLNTRIIQDADIFGQEIDGQIKMLWKVNQEKKGKPELAAMISLTYEEPDANSVYMKKRLSMMDKALYDAVGTLYHYNKQKNAGDYFFFTPEDVWRTAAGQANTGKTPSPKQTEKAIRCIDKWRFTRTVIDITDELEKQRISLDKNLIVGGCIDTYLLKADKVIFKTEKGKEVAGYMMKTASEDEPILYKYNKAKGHILEVPYSLLDVSGFTGNEGYTMEIKNYLLMRIALMYEGELQSNRILFETLYNYTRIPTPEEPEARKNNKSTYSSNASRQAVIRRYRSEDRKKIENILKCWINQKWICGFTPVKKVNEVIGVDILLNPDNKKKKTKKE